MKRAPSLLIALATVCCAATAQNSPSSEDRSIVIGRRAAPVKLDSARVVELCRTLGNAKSEEYARLAALSALAGDPKTSSAQVVDCLHVALAPERDVRLGAIKAAESLKPTDANCSLRLGATAVGDPEESVRDAAVALVKTRKDDLAVRTMIGHFVQEFDAAGHAANEPLAAAGTKALRDLGDKRVYQALLYMVTMEIRATNISSGSLDTRQIGGMSMHGNVPVALALPIQTPTLNAMSVRTSVCVPALAALKAVSGQDFGENWEKWGKWIAKQK